MRVPYRLYWQSARPASALLYPGGVAGLLRLCASIGGTNLPRIHTVSEGFLVVLDQPSEDAFTGAIRLRALAANVFLPVDAALSPALLPDEARALGIRQGVVFLPGVRILGFDPEDRIGPRELLRLPTLPPRAWRPPPVRPTRPMELTAIVLDLPPEDVLGGAGEGIGEETARPPNTGPVGEAAGGILSGLGRGLDKLGQWLDSERLRKLAAGMLRKAMEQAPRLTEKLLGKHEAALRDLLRRFREGDLEDALRHAVPLGNEPGRGGTIDDDPQLMRRDFQWTSADVQGTGGGRSWLSSDELFSALREQYRLAAEAAEAKGDYLRAAAIHGKLLGDWRRAAALLSRAGRHHDAALVYHDKLGDALAAAAAFEAAGEFDSAVDLYLQENRTLEAADLLRRVGEEDRAMEYYLAAASSEANRGNYATAARLMTTRALAPHLAGPFLVQGWKCRPSADAVECLNDLMGNYLSSEREAELGLLLDEADAYFASPGDDATASHFYNRLVTLAPRRDDLRDRSLRGLAGKLRQRANDGDRGVGVVSLLFGREARWDAATVRDAEYALKASARPAEPTPRKGHRAITVHFSTLTAVAQAAEAGTLILGFADGCVARYDPTNDRVTKLTVHPEPVVAVSCSPDGEMIALLRRQNEEVTLAAYQSHPDVWISTLNRVLSSRPGNSLFLTPCVGYGGTLKLGMVNGDTLTSLTGHSLTPNGAAVSLEEIVAVWSVPPMDNSESAGAFLIYDSSRTFHGWRFADTIELDSFSLESIPLPEQLACSSFLAWTEGEASYYQFAWRSDQGQACCLRLRRDNVKFHRADCQLWNTEHCLAVTLLDSSRVAAVHERGITWLRAGLGPMSEQGRSETVIPDAVAAFASPRTGELLVVTRFGDVVRVPLPG